MSARRRKSNANKAPNDQYYLDQRLSDEVMIYNLRLTALKTTYMNRLSSTTEKKARLTQLQNILQSKKDVHEEKSEERIDILTNYTRQNKVEEAKGIDSIVASDTSLNALMEEKLRLLKEMDTIEQSYDRKMREAKNTYDALCQREAEMEIEFANMLGDVERGRSSVAKQQQHQQQQQQQQQHF